MHTLVLKYFSLSLFVVSDTDVHLRVGICQFIKRALLSVEVGLVCPLCMGVNWNLKTMHAKVVHIWEYISLGYFFSLFLP